MAVYQVIAPITAVKVGAYGAAEGACTDIGSVKQVAWGVSADVEYATAGEANGAPVAATSKNERLTVKVTGDSITLANLALAFRGTTSGTHLKSDLAGGALTEKTLFLTGETVEGVTKTLHVYKCVIEPGTELVSDEQRMYTLTIVGLYDSSQSSGERTFKLIAGAADTTPPTVSTVSPADAASGVARAASTKVVWTFSEAIRSEDVSMEKFGVVSSSGTVIAGGVAITDAANTEVTFTKTSCIWGATTTYITQVKQGVRDTAGNKLAADFASDFTTAA